MYSKLTIKTPKPRQWHRSGVFIVNFEHISHLVLVLLLLALSLPAGPDLMSSVILEVNVIMKLNQDQRLSLKINMVLSNKSGSGVLAVNIRFSDFCQILSFLERRFWQGTLHKPKFHVAAHFIVQEPKFEVKNHEQNSQVILRICIIFSYKIALLTGRIADFSEIVPFETSVSFTYKITFL